MFMGKNILTNDLSIVWSEIGLLTLKQERTKATIP